MKRPSVADLVAVHAIPICWRTGKVLPLSDEDRRYKRKVLAQWARWRKHQAQSKGLIFSRCPRCGKLVHRDHLTHPCNQS